MVAGAVRFTETVHDAAAPIVVPNAPPDRLTVVAPATAATMPPVHVVAAAGVLETTKPPGSGSVTERFVKSGALATLVNVMVSRVVPPIGTGDTENALATVNALVGVRVAVAAVRLFPPAVTRAPMAIVLVAAASGAVAATVTGTVIVQVP